MPKRFNALPGFNLAIGFTLFYLSAIVLLPFAGLVLRTCELSWSYFWRLATTERALAAYRLTFGASLAAAVANACFGSLLAWVLVRYEFPGRRFLDAMVDFPRRIDRFRPGVCPGGRGIWFDCIYFGQPAVQNRDRSLPDCYPPGGI